MGLQVYVYLLMIKEENSGFTGLQVYIYAIIIKGKQSWFTCLQVYIYSISSNSSKILQVYRFTGLHALINKDL